MSATEKKVLSAAALELANSLLQATPDMLEALAEYTQLPQGTFHVKLACSSDPIMLKDADIPYFRIEASIVEILGLADDVDELDVPKVGAICSELFNITEPMGQGKLRQRLEALSAIMDVAEGTSNADILDAANELEIKIVTGPMRESKGVMYTSIKAYAPLDD